MWKSCWSQQHWKDWGELITIHYWQSQTFKHEYPGFTNTQIHSLHSWRSLIRCAERSWQRGPKSLCINSRNIFVIHHPPSVIRHPSDAIRHPSAAIHHPSTVIRHPLLSAFYRLALAAVPFVLVAKWESPTCHQCECCLGLTLCWAHRMRPLVRRLPKTISIVQSTETDMNDGQTMARNSAHSLIVVKLEPSAWVEPHNMTAQY